MFPLSRACQVPPSPPCSFYAACTWRCLFHRLHIPCTCLLSFIPTSFRVFPPLLCGTPSVDACLGNVHGYRLWDLVYLRLFWLLLELDIHPRLQPSFTIFQGLLHCFLASVDAERVDAILVLDLLCTGLFLSVLKSFWEALRIFSIHSVLKSNRVLMGTLLCRVFMDPFRLVIYFPEL